MEVYLKALVTCLLHTSSSVSTADFIFFPINYVINKYACVIFYFLWKRSCLIFFFFFVFVSLWNSSVGLDLEKKLIVFYVLWWYQLDFLAQWQLSSVERELFESLAWDIFWCTQAMVVIVLTTNEVGVNFSWQYYHCYKWAAIGIPQICMLDSVDG